MSINFQYNATYTTDSGPASIAAADLDGDGFVDLVVANSGSSTVAIYLGASQGQFARYAAFPTDSTPVSVAIGDLGGDGKPDIVTANYNGNDATLVDNLGNRRFSLRGSTAQAGTQLDGVIIADVNGDGNVDLVFPSYTGSAVVALFGAGLGRFGTRQVLAGVPLATSVASTDVNGDGKLDLVSTGYGGNTVVVLIGDGAGNFTRSDNQTGAGPSDVAAGDVNGDGKVDLVVTNQNANTVSVLLGNGNGTFQAKQDYATGTTPKDVKIADINGDAKPDLVVANSGSSDVSVLLGNGDGTFQAHQDVRGGTGTGTSSVGVVDVNGDGKPDIVATDQTSNDFFVLLNTTIYPPAAPVLANDNGSSATDKVTSDPTITYPTPASGYSLLYSTDGTNYSTTPPTFKTDGSQDGQHTVYIELASGGQTSAPSSLTFTLDTGPSRPSTPVLVPGQDTGTSSSDGITAVNTPTLTGTATPNAPVAIYRDNAILVGSGTADQNGNYAITTSPLPDGRHQLYALSTDSYGIRKSGVTGVLYLTIEATPPATPTTPVLAPGSDGGAAGDGLTDVKAPDLVGTTSPGARVSLFEDDSNGNPVRTLGQAFAGADGSYRVTATPLADGAHVLSAEAQNAAGVVSALSATTTITIDTTPPPAPSAPMVAGASNGATSSTEPTVTGTGTNGTTVTLYADKAVVLGSGAVDANGNYTITSSSPLGEGRHQLYTIATDAAGNRSAGVAGVTYVTVQTAAPAATAPMLAAGSDTGVQGDEITAQRAPDVTGMSVAGATVTLYDTNGTTMLGSSTARADGSYTIASSALADGQHTLSVVATSASGVVGPRSDGTAITIDTTAPGVPTLTLDPGSDTGAQGDGMTSDTMPTFTGTAEAGAAITLYADNAVKVGSTSADDTGAYSVTSSTLADGRHQLYATATDAAGNASRPAITYLTITPAAMAASMNAMANAMNAMTTSSSSPMTATAPSGTPETTMAAGHG